MTDKETIEREISDKHTRKGRRVLKATYVFDSKRQLESVVLRCAESYVRFNRSSGVNFVSRALAWLKKGEA